MKYIITNLYFYNFNYKNFKSRIKIKIKCILFFFFFLRKYCVKFVRHIIFPGLLIILFSCPFFLSISHSTFWPQHTSSDILKQNNEIHKPSNLFYYTKNYIIMKASLDKMKCFKVAFYRNRSCNVPCRRKLHSAINHYQT